MLLYSVTYDGAQTNKYLLCMLEYGVSEDMLNPLIDKYAAFNNPNISLDILIITMSTHEGWKFHHMVPV